MKWEERVRKQASWRPAGSTRAARSGAAVQEPDLGAGADGDAVGLDGQPHGPLEVVVRQGQLARRDADGDDLAGLVGGHEQRDAELAQQRRQRVRVLVADFARGRSAVPFGRRRRRRCRAGPRLSPMTWEPPCSSRLRDGGLRYNGSDSAPARRPSAGAVPGRWGACLAVRTPPAASCHV